MSPSDTDVIARILALEQAVAERDGRFQALIDGLQVGVVVQGPASEILLANLKALELLDMSEQQLRGLSSLDPSWNIVREDGSSFAGPDRPVVQALRTRQAVRDVTMAIFRPTRGDWVWLLVSAMPQLRPDGSVIQVVATFTDITGRKRIEDRLDRVNSELMLTRDAALAASRAKTTFLANMSHELRTPLNAIIGYTDLLLEEVPAGTDDLLRVKRAALHLLGLIDDVLEVTRIEAGRVGITVQVCDPAAIAFEIAEAARVLAERNHNVFRLHLADDVAAAELLSDPRRIRQILFNLLGNACKFCVGGIIELRVRCDGDTVVFSIADTGPGIHHDQLAAIFEPFHQVDPSRIRRDEGAGLGLTISRQLAEALGGELCATSEPGRGATFSLRLPPRHPTVAVASSQIPAAGPPRTVTN